MENKVNQTTSSAFPHFSLALLRHPFLACSVMVFNPLLMNGVKSHKIPLNEMSALYVTRVVLGPFLTQMI